MARGSRAPGPGWSCISRAGPGATRASGTVPAEMTWFPPWGEAATFYLIFKIVNNHIAKSSGRVSIQDSSLGKDPLAGQNPFSSSPRPEPGGERRGEGARGREAWKEPQRPPPLPPAP